MIRLNFCSVIPAKFITVDLMIFLLPFVIILCQLVANSSNNDVTLQSCVPVLLLLIMTPLNCVWSVEALVFFFGNEQAKEYAHNISMTCASSHEQDMDNDIDLFQSYGKKNCENIQKQFNRLKIGYLHFEGWMLIIQGDTLVSSPSSSRGSSFHLTCNNHN